MAWKSLSEINWTKGLGGALEYTNEVTYGWISNLILIGVYFVVMAGYYKSTDDLIGGFAAAAFMLIFMALFLYLVGFVSWIVLAMSISIGIISIAPVFFDKL